MNKYFEHCEKIAGLYAKTVNKVANNYHLTHMEFTILMFLYNNPDFNTASEMVKCRLLTKSHVSMSVKSLIKKGLIIDTIDEIDHRITHLKLVDKALLIAEDGLKAQKEFFKLIFTGFNDNDLNEFKKYLLMININIDNIC